MIAGYRCSCCKKINGKLIEIPVSIKDGLDNLAELLDQMFAIEKGWA